VSFNRGVVYLGPGKVDVRNIDFPIQTDHDVVLRYYAALATTAMFLGCPTPAAAIGVSGGSGGQDDAVASAAALAT
jgi:hypothetical protein